LGLGDRFRAFCFGHVDLVGEPPSVVYAMTARSHSSLAIAMICSFGTAPLEG
jgi:hypothetical protein